MKQLSNAALKNNSSENHPKITEFCDAASVACDILKPTNISIS